MKKLKINIRPASDPRVEIHAAERVLFLCSECHNKYYQFSFYCPQCLGEVKPNHPEQRVLSILSFPEQKRGDLQQLLIRLSGKPDFSYEKAFDTLPWTMIAGSDPTVVAQWREILEAESVKVSVEPFDPKKKRKFRAAPPLFEKEATLPFFVAPGIMQGIRTVAKTIKSPAIRLKWVDAVLTAHRILEGFYKREPSARILFSDFLFQLESDLQDCIKRFGSYFHNHEEEFGEQAVKLKSEFEAMESEMEAVRRQVEEQL